MGGGLLLFGSVFLNPCNGEEDLEQIECDNKDGKSYKNMVSIQRTAYRDIIRLTIK